ncbi:hypothetical protein GT021_41150 [Streptomyces sp. SID5470]|uniref:Uncharacterized protein n=1 Tax=Streptomyces sviceus (strain ATCC 29083 / DSM 924 / JCM 4929 / NBRC 13980 / NCIMB 11184 / NRRL 5439 / UC 5370) TaxID=463191 RepID=B5HPM4_STRX2|nr:hypothetical protein [Streptomyces sp. CC0208]EDY54800.1 conserved hypothetical protein [Streptomyces sviceus ATCC 29083]MYT10602.1 hypothetical protein [Streptomyces sp. SID5470]
MVLHGGPGAGHRAYPDCGGFAERVKGSAVTRPRDPPYGESGLEFRWHKPTVVPRGPLPAPGLHRADPADPGWCAARQLAVSLQAAVSAAAVTVRVADMVDTLRKVAGAKAVDLVTVAPDPAVETVVGSRPAAFDHRGRADARPIPDRELGNVGAGRCGRSPWGCGRSLAAMSERDKAVAHRCSLW